MCVAKYQISLAHMYSEGYCSCPFCLFKSHLTSGAFVRPENTVTYSAGNRGQNICGFFSEIAPLWRSSTPSIESHTYSQPFYFIVFTTWWCRGFCTLVYSLCMQHITCDV